MDCQDNNVSYHFKKVGDKIFDSYRWSMTSEHTCNTLSKYGCTPKKSLTLKFPEKSIFKSEDLIRHFIRGYWDGDGCVSFTYKTHAINVLGTKEFLLSLKEYLPNMNNVNLSLHEN